MGAAGRGGAGLKERLVREEPEVRDICVCNGIEMLVRHGHRMTFQEKRNGSSCGGSCGRCFSFSRLTSCRETRVTRLDWETQNTQSRTHPSDDSSPAVKFEEPVSVDSEDSTRNPVSIPYSTRPRWRDMKWHRIYRGRSCCRPASTHLKTTATPQHLNYTTSSVALSFATGAGPRNTPTPPSSPLPLSLCGSPALSDAPPLCCCFVF